MSKYSSYKEHQLITENWRRYLKEESSSSSLSESTSLITETAMIDDKIKASWGRFIEALAQHADASGGMSAPDMPDMLNQVIYDVEKHFRSAEGLVQFLGLDAELAPYIERHRDEWLSGPQPYNAPYYKANKGFKARHPLTPQPDDYWNVDPQPGDGFEELRAKHNDDESTPASTHYHQDSTGRYK